MPQENERQVPPVRINQWAGLITAMSPYGMPAGGAQVQQNVQVVREGILEVRGGTRLIEWEN